MKQGLWHRRIPTGPALLILLIGLVVTNFLIQKGSIFVTRASPEKAPQNVIISNVTDSSFTVNFTTNTPTVAGISVEGAGTPYVVYDSRNKTAGDQKSYLSHYITVADLNPNTGYRFSIISDGEIYLLNGQKYSTTTGDRITGSPPQQTPVVGKVILPEGGAASDTIVSLEVPGGGNITALTRNTGEFIIPTNSIRTKDLKKYLTINPNEEVTITAMRQDSKTTLKLLFKNASSIPPITLSKKYDFTKVEPVEEKPSSSTPLKTPRQSSSGQEVRIISPKSSESFIDPRPLFRGTAQPGQNVKITIQSDPITVVVRADSSGNWSFRPNVSLLPGSHTITIQTLDRFGITKTVSQRFTIFSSGSQVAQSATPSATPIATKTPTPSPTRAPTPTLVASTTPSVTISPTSTISTTPSPTATVSSTPTPTVITTSTPTPSPTIIIASSPTPTTPPIITPAPTGSSTSIVLTIISVILIISGSALLFLL